MSDSIDIYSGVYPEFLQKLPLWFFHEFCFLIFQKWLHLVCIQDYQEFPQECFFVIPARILSDVSIKVSQEYGVPVGMFSDVLFPGISRRNSWRNGIPEGVFEENPKRTSEGIQLEKCWGPTGIPPKECWKALPK